MAARGGGCIWGVQTPILTPHLHPHHPPWEVQSVEEVWSTFHVGSKCSEFYGDFKYACKTGKKIFTADLCPQTWLLGPDPQWVNFFSKTPNMCVQNDQLDEGIICWGTRDPPLGAPTPPRTPTPP